MTEITFLYKDGSGRTSATSKASYHDVSRAIEAARLNLSERDYHDVELWAGTRQIARLIRPADTVLDAT